MRMLKSVIGIAALTAMVTAATAQSWITNGLVAYWPFSGNASDSVSTNDGTLIGAVSLTTDRNDAPNTAYLFSGGTISIPHNSKFGFTVDGEFTVSLWTFTIGNQTAMHPIGKRPTWSQSFNWQVCFNYGVLQYMGIYGNTGNNGFGAGAGSPLPLNQWKHLVGIYDKGTWAIYVDGVLKGTSVGGYCADSVCPLTIGRAAEFEPFYGKVDDVRIYTRALSTNEVAQLYAIEATPPTPRPASGTAVLANGFVVGVNLTYGGYGYTNTPRVQIIGGGGGGAQAVAVVSNGVVVAVNVLNAGYGYTSTPIVAITPPVIPRPLLDSAPMTLLSFSELAVGGSYQMQRQQAWYWADQGASFTASSSTRTQMVAGAAGTANYRLVLTPAPSQAFATPQMVNGFLVGATVTGGGSGYVSVPAVTIVGGGGHNATAVASLSGGVVTGITITSAGIGYTNTPTVRIAAPPAASLSPEQLPVVRLDAASLAPYENYQVQYKPAVDAAWANWADGLFSPTAATNSQHLYTSNSAGFFRLRYLP